MSKQILINDDCFNYLPLIEDKSVDMILCDLPYGNTHCSWDSPLDLTALWKEYERVIKDHGAILLFAQSPFDKILACSNLKLYRYDWIWEKTNATGHLNANRMPLRAHEKILVFYKKLPVFNPQKTLGHKPENHYRKYIATQNRTQIYKQQTKEISGGGQTSRYPRDVIVCSSEKQHNNLHPAQKPVALLEYLIKSYTSSGDLVLDNCMGAGSTPLACKNLNRNYIGIEKDRDIFNIAEKRLAS